MNLQKVNLKRSDYGKEKDTTEEVMLAQNLTIRDFLEILDNSQKPKG